MADTIPVANLAGLPATCFDPLTRELAGQTLMRLALIWFAAHLPPLAPEDLVAQDEFSYDLLVPHPGGVYLSYDTS